MAVSGHLDRISFFLQFPPEQVPNMAIAVRYQNFTGFTHGSVRIG